MTVMNRPSLDFHQDSRIDLAAVLRMLFDHKALILWTVSLFFLIGLGYAILATPVYQATAMIQIEPRKSASRAPRRSAPSHCQCRRRPPRSS